MHVETLRREGPGRGLRRAKLEAGALRAVSLFVFSSPKDQSSAPPREQFFNGKDQMALTSDPGARNRALALKGLTKDDIDPDEMDNVIMRIFQELRRQLSMMEAKKPDELDTADRERHARILSNLERTMERLSKLQSERAEARKSRAVGTADDARARVRSKITQILELELKGENSEGIREFE